MKRSQIIAGKLLEDDDLDSARDLFDNAREYHLDSLPPELRPLFEYAPDEFLFAYGRPDGNATWKTDASGYEWWPEQDNDEEENPPHYGWTQRCYYPEYEIENGNLVISVRSVDTDGDSDTMYAESWETMRAEKDRLFTRKEYHESIAKYYEWVASVGRDPLDFIFYTPEKVTTKWLVGVREVDGRPKFWKARAITNHKPSPRAVEDLARVPAEVKDYLMIDGDDGFLGLPMAEFTAAREVVQKDGFWQVTFETEAANDSEHGRRVHYKKVAAKAAKEHWADAAKATGSMILPF